MSSNLSNSSRGKQSILKFYQGLVKPRRGARGPQGSSGVTELRPDLYTTNNQTVPSYFGEQLKFTQSFNSLRIKIKLLNDTGDTLDFNGIPPVNTFSMYLKYYAEDNGTIAKPSTSTAFYPEQIIAVTTPDETQVANGNTFEYDIKFENLHYGIEQEYSNYSTFTKSWSIQFNVESNGGNGFLGEDIPLVSLAFTPYYQSDP